VFVEAGREASPLLQTGVVALDHVAVPVIDGIDSDGSAAAWSSTLAVPFLVIGLGDEGLDTAGAEVTTDRAGRVRLVAAERVRSSPRATKV